MREALGWLFAAILLGIALAFGLLMLIAPPAHAQAERPYTVYRVPTGCLYVAGTRQNGMALAFAPDRWNPITYAWEPCDGALKGVRDVR